MNTNAVKLISLSFHTLRMANLQRLPLFRNKHGQLCHNHDGSNWSDSQWLQAIAGEVGEYANVRKKFDRGDINDEEFEEQAASELADIFIYVDLFAFRRGIALQYFLPRATIREMQNDLAEFDEEIESLKAADFATRLLGVVGSLSSLSASVSCYPNGSSRSKTGVVAQLQHFIEVVIHLADALGIDLNDAVLKKFNAVSDRVKAPVYFVQVTDPEGDYWRISDVPF